MKTLPFAFALVCLFASAAARAELPAEEAVYTDADFFAGEDDAQVIQVKTYVGPGVSYSNSDGVSWENGVCMHGCHRHDDDQDSDDRTPRRKNKRDRG